MRTRIVSHKCSRMTTLTVPVRGLRSTSLRRRKVTEISQLIHFFRIHEACLLAQSLVKVASECLPLLCVGRRLNTGKCSPQASRIHHTKGIHRHSQTLHLEIAHTLLQQVPQHGHVPSITRVSSQLLVVEHFRIVVLKSCQGITLIPPDSHPRRWSQRDTAVNEEVVQAHAAFNYSGSFSQRHFQGFLKNAPSVGQHTECAFDDHSQAGVVEGEDRLRGRDARANEGSQNLPATTVCCVTKQIEAL